MYRSLAEAAANCTRNLATGVGTSVIRKNVPDSNRGVLKRYTLDDDLDGNDKSPSGRILELVNCLKEEDRGARVSAVCAIAELRDEAGDAVPALIEAIEDHDWIVRVAAITALGEIGAAAHGAVEALTGALEHDDVCGTAAIALGRIGSAAKAAIPALTKLRSCKNSFLVWCGEEAIRSIKGV